MPNSDTIPSGSVITEEMITAYIAIYGGLRNAAISAMHNIEIGTTAPSTAQRGNPMFSSLVSSYDANAAAFGEGGEINAPTTSNDVMIAGPTGTGRARLNISPSYRPVRTRGLERSPLRIAWGGRKADSAIKSISYIIWNSRQRKLLFNQWGV